MITWLVWQIDELPEEARRIEAETAEEAAEEWGSQEDSYGDFWLVREGSTVVWATLEGSDDAPSKLVVGAEETIIYSAYREA